MNIDPRTLQPGDRFRRAFYREGTVESISPEGLLITTDGQGFHIQTDPRYTWELIERPRKPLTVWRDPEGGGEYVLLPGGNYIDGERGNWLSPGNAAEDEIIARLVPAEQDGE